MGATHSNNQVLGVAMLENIAGSTAPKGLCSNIRSLEHGQINDLRCEKFLLQLFAGIEPVELRHRNIQNDYIGAQFRCGLDQIAPVGDRSDDIEFGLEKGLARPGDQFVIVCNKPTGASVFHDQRS